jgi:uncharacterized protein YdaU (DUF1376 family)
MHYYQHHIGDFIKATARLTDTQCMTYLRLLWMYYDTEKPLEQDIDTIAFQLGANPKDVGMILNAFFHLKNEAWYHTRCDEEISKFHLKSDRAKTANKIRWGSKMDKKSDPDQIATNNHKPITNIKTNTTPQRPDDVSEIVWNDWLRHRKTLKAIVTETVIKKIRSEAVKAGIPFQSALELMCARGWRGFEADWVKPNETKSTDWWVNDRRIK